MRHKQENNKRRYEVLVSGVPEIAEPTCSRMNAGTIIADHISVPDALRARGIGRTWDMQCARCRKTS